MCASQRQSNVLYLPGNCKTENLLLCVAEAAAADDVRLHLAQGQPEGVPLEVTRDGDVFAGGKWLCCQVQEVVGGVAG